MTYVTSPVDLTNCDREAIHLPGSIQPHGVMLVCEPEGDVVLHASANAGWLLGREPADIVARPLGDVIGPAAAHAIRNASAKAGGGHVAGLVHRVTLRGGMSPLDIAVHRYGDRVLVEFEPSNPDTGDGQDTLDLTQALIQRIGTETEVDRIATMGAKLIRMMLGYDRVMIYRFLHNDAGRVIAEARRPDMSAFLGQHFPASDIPVQARRLYTLNWIRMVGDAAYVPVPLTPLIGEGVPPLDMSYAQLRSVSPIHCEYLRNMGVSASLSISIVVDGKLWGLIACHHDSPKVVPLALRVGAELFGRFFSQQIASAERRGQFHAAAQARQRLDRLIASIDPAEPVVATLRARLPQLADLVPCAGAGLWIDGEWASTGLVPPPDAVAPIMRVLAERAGAEIWNSHALGRDITDVADFGTDVAGLLAVPISSAPRDYLVFFRSEEAHEIEWAGEPSKAVTWGPHGARLTPRGSFETWREEVRGQCTPWTEAELAVAEATRNYLRDVVLRYNEANAEERARTEERRRLLNAELNHRVKNIISLVTSIARQTATGATTSADYAASLEGRLRALAFAHDQSMAGEGGDLAALIEAEATLHRDEAAPHRVVLEGPPVGLGTRAFGVIALLVHEMMTNAAKYGALARAGGRLEIRWSLDADGDCVITWEESGGPPVTPPTRTGFGSTLIRGTIAYDLDGTAEVDYPPEGVRGRFVVPARHLHESRATVAPPPPPAAAAAVRGPAQGLPGVDVLLVEDQAIIAMDLEDELRLAGATVRPVASVRAALAAISEHQPACAILDVNLGDETSMPIAEALQARGVPFVFATGYGDRVMIPDGLRAVPVIGKPIDVRELVDTLRSLLDGRA